MLAELSRIDASAVSGLPGRIAGVGWVVVPLGPVFSPGVILADMQLEEREVGEAESAKRARSDKCCWHAVLLALPQLRCIMVRLAGGMFARSGSLAEIQEAPLAAPRGGCA